MKNSANKILLTAAAVMLVAFVALYGYQNFGPTSKSKSGSPLNASYVIEGERLQLSNGMASQLLAADSEVLAEVQLIDQPVYGDLDGDGDDDALVALSYNPGGSGVFYYVAAAVKEGDDYFGGEAYFLGDRVRLQSLKVQNGQALVEYFDRAADAAFAAEPSEPVELRLVVANGRLSIETGRSITDEDNNEGNDDLVIDQVVSYKDLIVVSWPLDGGRVSSPLTVQGRARGPWYFEAGFPVTLLDENGAVLVESYATAKGEWMTEDYVPFEAVLNFNAVPGTKGSLLIKKDNPSGLPENDDQFIMSVTF